MKKLALKILNSMMRTKDPFMFGTVLVCLMILAYTAGWFHVSPMSMIDGAVKMWTEEEVVIQKAKE